MALAHYERNRRNLAQRIKEGLVLAEEWRLFPDRTLEDFRTYRASESILGSSPCYFCQQPVRGARWQIIDRVDKVQSRIYFLHHHCYTSAKES